MRKIACLDMHGVTVQEVLDELNERRHEFGIMKESDIISISTRAVTHPHNIAMPNGDLEKSQVVVTIFYWSEGEKNG